MAIDVFLSVGRATAEQERFVAAVERCLQDRGLEPHTLGRNDWSSLQPLTAISDLMGRCSGVAVIAFERIRISKGADVVRGAELEAASFPTVWNQIEASMAYTMGLPLLVFAEHGLRSEGLIEARYDWMVQWVSLDPEEIQVNPSRGVIDDWKRRVTEHASRQEAATGAEDPVDLSQKSVGEVMGMLRPGQLYGLLGVCVTIVVGAFTLGATLGGG